MMNKKAALALIVTAALMTGCAPRTAPIQNVSQTVGQSYTDSQMQRAIVEAGAANHWVISPAGPGVMNGKLSERGHTADIRMRRMTDSNASREGMPHSENLTIPEAEERIQV